MIYAGEFNEDKSGSYVSVEEPSLRTNLPIGKEYLEQNAKLK